MKQTIINGVIIYRHECFTGKYTTRKIHKNYIGTRVAKTIFYSLAALVRKILFCHSKKKFISSRHRLISSIYFGFANTVLICSLVLKILLIYQKAHQRSGCPHWFVAVFLPSQVFLIQVITPDG